MKIALLGSGPSKRADLRPEFRVVAVGGGCRLGLEAYDELFLHDVSGHKYFREEFTKRKDIVLTKRFIDMHQKIQLPEKYKTFPTMHKNITAGPAAMEYALSLNPLEIHTFGCDASAQYGTQRRHWCLLRKRLVDSKRRAKTKIYWPKFMESWKWPDE